MAQVYAKINKETIGFICSQIGVTVSFLSQKTGYTEDSINAWLDTSSNAFPTIGQAKKLAKALKVPFAGLYINKKFIPIKKLPPLRNLRTLTIGNVVDDSSLNLAVVELIRYHDFLTSSESEMEIEVVPLSLPSIPDTTNAPEYAKSIREFFDIKLDDQFYLTSSRKFYLYVRQKVESKGIFVHCFTGVDVDTARGISIFNDTAPIIGVNANDWYPAKTFSIIHELVHILKRQSTLCNEMVASFSSSSEEVFCNAVAGNMLVPTDSLNAYLNINKITTISYNDIETMAKKYCISKEVISRRLLDIERITPNEYDTFVYEIQQNFLLQRNERRDGNGRKIYKNISREAIDKTSSMICHILLIGYSNEYFSMQEVSGFLGIKEQHIPKFLTEVAKW
jgi:Zn-dependent peptidase ImmA (M78 family)